MDIYSTTYLNGVVDSLKRPQSFLIDRFFGTVVQSDTETIKFDVADGKRRISPFVHPLKEGKVVESLGYKTDTFEPAYVKDKRVIDPNKPLKRMAGEQIGGSLTPANRIQMNIVSETADQVSMLMRRLETMAAEALLTGKVTVTGDGYPTVSVDFGRAAGHTIDLSGGGAEWDDVGISPLANLGTWSMLVLQATGAMVTDVIFSIEAWELFILDAKVVKILDYRRANDSSGMVLTIAPIPGAQFMGNIGNYNCWVYHDWYVDANDAEQRIMPANTVILTGAQMQGVRHFGAIRDEAAGYQAREFFSKSWIEEDPAVRFLMMQSAPLVVPYRPNASLAATVT